MSHDVIDVVIEYACHRHCSLVLTCAEITTSDTGRAYELLIKITRSTLLAIFMKHDTVCILV